MADRKYHCFSCNERIYFDQRRKPLSVNAKGNLVIHKCKKKPVIDQQEMKAIPTFYRGIKMRSRLEANFAAFMDSLKIKWQYEPQSFLLPSMNISYDDGRIITGSKAIGHHELEHYFPDFYLSEINTWIEVKNPTKFTDFTLGTGAHFAGYLTEEFYLHKPDNISLAWSSIPSYIVISTSDCTFTSYHNWGADYFKESRSSDVNLSHCVSCDKSFFLSSWGTYYYACKGCGFNSGNFGDLLLDSWLAFQKLVTKPKIS